MPRGAFTSAILNADGTVTVKGPFSLDSGEPNKPAVLAFSLSQGDKSVEGEGHWFVGDPEWTGTGNSDWVAGDGVELGDAVGLAVAVLSRNDPAGFVTYTWTSTVEVTAE
jgi:hypothetical protein